jgi:hypothetical protein
MDNGAERPECQPFEVFGADLAAGKGEEEPLQVALLAEVARLPLADSEDGYARWVLMAGSWWISA